MLCLGLSLGCCCGCGGCGCGWGALITVRNCIEKICWRHHDIHILDCILEFKPTASSCRSTDSGCRRRSTRLINFIVHAIHVRSQIYGVIDKRLFL